MELPSVLNLDILAEIGLRGGVDMRPTLLRVLTDLYVQKLRHTPDEERHYTELALRLLDGVDVATRTAVAARLARHLSPPPRVVQYLLNDLPDVAATMRSSHAVLAPPAAVAETSRRPASAPIAKATAAVEPQPPASPVADATDEIAAPTARELNEQFFAATAYERRLILLNLHVVAPVATGRVVVSRDPTIAKRLEAAALGQHRDDLAKQLAAALQIANAQGRRIARDDLGEPIIVAVKALGIARDVVHRILMFFNPAVGHSVERVRALAALHDEMPLPAAEGMVAIWQALHDGEHATPKHQALYWNDERSHARAMVPARHPQTAAQPRERRGAS